MHKFKYSREREWSISLNGWTLKRLKEELDFDARDHESILRVSSDPALLCNVLFVLCEDQAKEKSVTDRDFGMAMTGDAIEAAADAYMQETADFFPRQKQALNTMLARMKETQDRATALATEKLNSPAMSQMIDKAMSEQSQKIDDLLAGTSTGNSSGKSLA
jgi:hypothetical protein